jgi:hypothetical protein
LQAESHALLAAAEAAAAAASSKKVTAADVGRRVKIGGGKGKGKGKRKGEEVAIETSKDGHRLGGDGGDGGGYDGGDGGDDGSDDGGEGGEEGGEEGVLRWVGKADFGGKGKSSVFCGVELDRSRGARGGSGTVLGREYFTCAKGHATFVPRKKVSVVREPVAVPVVTLNELSYTAAEAHRLAEIADEITALDAEVARLESGATLAATAEGGFGRCSQRPSAPPLILFTEPNC